MATTPSMLGSRYEVGELLGHGGMAEVHRAQDTRLGRTVAVKVLRPDLAADPAFQARFRREAQSAASLNHPAVVAVYDTGEDVADDGAHVPYIVMEYVQGQTLRQILAERGGAEDDEADQHLGGGDEPRAAAGLDPAEAASITARVLQALGYSHRAGIVHRDIKPANVMVTPAGDVKVMDFGIARAMRDAASTMTQTQAVIGTAQYLSPEQARGEPVDARSDLYSTGCLLYELLTGRPPFVGDSAVSVAYQHVRETPRPPSALVPEIPDVLDRVVMKALAKDREDRYPNAGAFAADLRTASAGGRVSAPALGATAAPTQAMATSPPGGDPPTAAFHARTADPTQTVTFGQVEDEAPRGRRRVGGYVLLALAVLAVFVAGAFGVSQLLSDTGTEVAQVQVPSVIGQPREAARAQIDAAGLGYEENTTADDAAEGTVIDQSPEASTTVDEGEVVTVTVSEGPAQVEVPDVTGQSQDQAARTLREAGLQLGAVTTTDDPDIPEGSVISSDPAAGTEVEEDSAVALVVASGDVDLPDVTGQDYRDARGTLEDLGLAVAVEPEGSEQPQDEVIRQSPSPGRVSRDTTVTLTYSEQVTPEPTQTTPTQTPTPTGSPSPTPSETSTSPSPAPGTPAP